MAYHLRKEDLAYRRVADEYFVLTLADSILHNVTGAGVRIMELLDEGLSQEEIAVRLGAEYDADAAAISADVAAFLAELEEKGIVNKTEG